MATTIILQTGPRHGKMSGAVAIQEEIMGKFIDLTGQRFGAWHVIKRAEWKANHAFWECECDCGTIRYVSSSSLRRGFSKSCGCKRNEQIKQKNYKHGESRTLLYTVWQGMIYRKTKHNAQIPVCEEWKDFFNFAAWARTHGYRKGLFLSRIDMEQGWYPENACFRIKRNPCNRRILKYPPIPKLKNGKRKI